MQAADKLRIPYRVMSPALAFEAPWLISRINWHLRGHLPTRLEAFGKRALELAHQEGWKVRLDGRGSWTPGDAPADLVVTTSALDTVVQVAPQDLVATVEAGAAFGAVQRRLAEDRVWLSADPPGRAQRSS